MVSRFNLHFPNDLRCGASFQVICVSSLVMCLMRSLAHFLIRLIVFLLVFFKSSLCILDKSPLLDIFYKYFSPVCGLSSNSLDIFYRTEIFNFSEIHFIFSTELYVIFYLIFIVFFPLPFFISFVVHVHESLFLFAQSLHPLISPSPPAVICCLIYESVSVLLVSSVCSLDSTYEWNHMEFVFLWLAYPFYHLFLSCINIIDLVSHNFAIITY